jgi:hypothetical protein
MEIEAASAGDDVARAAIRLERMRAKVAKSEVDKPAAKDKGKKGKQGSDSDSDVVRGRTRSEGRG